MRNCDVPQPRTGAHAHDVTALELRAATDADRDFSFAVAREALGPYARALGVWDDARAREIEDDRFSSGNFEIIEVAGVRVGCLRCAPGEDHLRLVRLALLPEWQGRGIGSAVLRLVIQRAAALSVPVRLRVMINNPARRLYERFGFTVYQTDATHDYMVRPAQAPRREADAP